MDREHIVPVEAMAKWLNTNGADLGCEVDCSKALRIGFIPADVEAGLDQAIELARVLRQESDTPLRMTRDLVACALALVTALLLVAMASPARAADGRLPTDAETCVLVILAVAAWFATVRFVIWWIMPHRGDER